MASADTPYPNPFPGLRPFRSDEHHLFFGREDQTAALLQLLRTNRFLAVVGTSGSGKSSLVRAGLIAELHGGAMTQAGSTWDVMILRPGGSPLENLARAMGDAGLYEAEDASTLPRLLATLSRSRYGLVEAMKQSEGFTPGANLLVVVDQFEELFRFRQQGVFSEETAAAFVNLLITASEQTECPIYVAITMRSDYLGECSEIPGLAEAVNDGEYLIPRLLRDQKRDAIEKPIGVGGARIDPLLVQRLLNDVGDDPDQLPVLQHALMRMWNVWSAGNDHDRPIDQGDFEATGGLSSALSNHADEIYAALPDERHRSTCEKMFKALTEKGQDNRGIRRPTRLTQLQAIAHAERATITTVLDAFRGSGVTFLMPGIDVKLNDETVLDLSHESLMRGWQRLRGWVEDEAQSARVFRRLSDTARLWSMGKAGYFRDPDLQIALTWRDEEAPNSVWADQYGGDFDGAIAFLEASHTEAQAESQAKEAARQRELAQARELAEVQRLRLKQQQRAARKLQMLIAGVAAIAAVAIATSIVAGRFWQEASAAKVNAEKSEELARENAAAAKEARDDAARQAAGLLLDRGIEDARSGEVTRALHLFVRALRTRPPNDLPSAPLERAIRTNLTAWAATAPALEHILPEGPAITQMAFSPDGEQIAIAISKDEVQCYRTDTGRASGPLIKLAGEVGHSLAFAADGRSLWITSPGPGKVIEKWSILRIDPTTGQPVQPPISTPGPFYAEDVNSLVPTPDGRYLVGAVLGLHPDDRGPLGDADGTRLWRTASIMVWETVSGRLVRTENVNSDIAFSKTFLNLSPDGKSVVAWIRRGGKYQGITFSVDGKEPPKNLGPHPGSLSPGSTYFEHRYSTLHFQNNLRTALTIKDGQIHRWSMANPGVLTAGITTPFRSMLDQPAADGRFVISPDEARIYDSGAWPPRPTGVKFAHPGWTNLGDNLWSRDGRFIATKLQQGMSERRIWRLPRPWSRPPLPPSEYVRLPDNRNYYRLGQFDAHATNAVLWWLPRSDDTHNIRIVDAATGIARGTSVRHAGLIRDIAFTPDGRYFATASFDATARVWETATGRPVGAPMQHLNYVACVSFSPDGNILAAGDYGPDGLIKLWDWRNGKEIRAPFQHNDIILHVSFSPEGKHLAALKVGDWSKKPELIIWDVASAKPVFRIPHSCPGYLVRDAARFRPDGRAVAARDTAGVLHLWEVPSGKVLGVCPLDGDGVTRFSPDGRTIAATANRGVRLFDAANLTPLPGGYISHPDPINDVAFSPDGALVLTAHESGSAQLWDLATRKALGPPVVLIGPARAVAFSPDGKTCLSIAADGAVRRWPLPLPYAEADLDRMADRVALMTGQRMDSNQGIDSLPFDEWRSLRAKMVGDGSTAIIPLRPDADWHDSVAADAEQDSDVYGAEWHLDRLEPLRPKDWTIPSRRGRLLAAAGQKDAAAAAYATATRLAPTPQVVSDWLRARAADEEAAGRKADAVWNLGKAITLTPNDWTLYTLRANLVDPAQSVADEDEAIRRGAEPGIIEQMCERAAAAGNWKRAATLLTSLGGNPAIQVQISSAKAVACLKAGDSAGYRAVCAAISSQFSAISPEMLPRELRNAATVFTLGPKAIDSWVQPLALIDHGLARLAELEKTDSTLKDQIPRVRPRYLNVRGAVLYRAGRFEEAAKMLREGTRLHPEGGEFRDWAFLALSEQQLGNKDAAKTAAEKARAIQANLQPNTPWEKAEVELLAAELDREQPAKSK